MSEVYVKEPNTEGKVVLHTSLGDLDIELWPKETPKACRNFVQLCMEGYYNDTIFHRVIPGFTVQAGCPKGTGETCESIYGEPYVTEAHGRLKFRYRGMVGVANAGRNTKTNGSQFFITLARTDMLNNTNTLFGKVVGNTIYNLLKIGELETNKADRPREPPVIRGAEVVWNPFDDIVPRCLPPVMTKSSVPAEKKPIEAVMKRNLVSFEEEASSGEDEGKAFTKAKVKSAHDVIGGRLSKECTYDAAEAEMALREQAAGRRASSKRSGAEEVSASKREKRAVDPAPARSRSASSSSSSSSSRPSDGILEARAKKNAQDRKDEINKLRREILAVESGGTLDGDREARREPKTELERRNEKYESQRRGDRDKAPLTKGERDRKARGVLAGLKDFTARLRQAKAKGEENEAVEKKKSEQKRSKENAPEAGTFAEVLDGYEHDDDSDLEDWAAGSLKFHISADKAYQLDKKRGKEALEVFDPMVKKNSAAAEMSRDQIDRTREMLKRAREQESSRRGRR